MEPSGFKDLKKSTKTTGTTGTTGTATNGSYPMGVEYQLRTPLTTLLGLCELLDTTAFPEELREPIQEIQKAGREVLEAIERQTPNEIVSDVATQILTKQEDRTQENGTSQAAAPIGWDATGTRTQMDTARGRILVVDDVPMNCVVLCGMLRKLGFETIGIGSAVEAIHYLNLDEEPVDLILTDEWMPEMSGHEFARYLATDRVTQKIPILAVSADTQLVESLDSHASSEPSPFHAVLLKPVTIHQMQAILDEYFPDT